MNVPLKNVLLVKKSSHFYKLLSVMGAFLHRRAAACPALPLDCGVFIEHQQTTVATWLGTPSGPACLILPTGKCQVDGLGIIMSGKTFTDFMESKRLLSPLPTLRHHLEIPDACPTPACSCVTAVLEGTVAGSTTAIISP